MKTKRYEKGFGVVEILLVILVIGLVIALGWNFYNNRSTKSETSNSSQGANASGTSSNSSVQYLTLKDFKVRIPLSDKTSKLTLGTVGVSSYNQSDKAVSVLAPELDASWTCESTNGEKGTIGTISITTQAVRSGPNQPLVTKKIGNYTYGFESTAANCTSESATYQELVDAFKVQFESIEAY